MDERAERVGKNEALFRHVNERIEDVNRAFAPLTERIDIVCECGAAGCAERVELSVPDYERVRSDPRRFILLDGHETPDVERVVERGDGWVVVEKHDGKAAEIAVRTDPRS
jgi:hypothetical protein